MKEYKTGRSHLGKTFLTLSLSDTPQICCCLLLHIRQCRSIISRSWKYTPLRIATELFWMIQRPIYKVTRSQHQTHGNSLRYVMKNPVTRNAHQAVTNVYRKLFERFKLISTNRKASYVNFWTNYPMILKLRFIHVSRGELEIFNTFWLASVLPVLLYILAG